MNRLFSHDSPIMRALTLFADLVIVNLVTIVFSIPVVTAGAAITAACRVTRQLMNGEGSHLIRSFWAVFRENWKQATVVWVVVLLVVLGLGYDVYLFQGLFDEQNYRYAVGLLVVLLFLTVGIAVYLFFLISRYENTLVIHLKNAFALFFHYLPKTIGMTLLNALPFVLFVFSPYLFLQTFVIWVGFGFASILYVDNLLMRPVFRELENQDSGAAE